MVSFWALRISLLLVFQLQKFFIPLHEDSMKTTAVDINIYPFLAMQQLLEGDRSCKLINKPASLTHGLKWVREENIWVFSPPYLFFYDYNYLSAAWFWQENMFPIKTTVKQERAKRSRESSGANILSYSSMSECNLYIYFAMEKSCFCQG